MAVIVNLTTSVKPELREEFLHDLSLVLPGTRSYSGCHWVYLTKMMIAIQLELFRNGTVGKPTRLILLGGKIAVPSA